MMVTFFNFCTSILELGSLDNQKGLQYRERFSSALNEETL